MLQAHDQLSFFTQYCKVGNLEEKTLICCEFRSFVAIRKKVSPQNLGAWCLLARQKRAIHDTCSFRRKIGFLPIREFPAIQSKW